MWLTRWKHWKTVSATSKNLTSITLGSGSKPVLWLLSEAPCNCTGTSMKTMALIIWSHPGSPRIISKDILGICVEWVATIPIPLPSNFCTECKGKLLPPSSKMKGQRDNWSYNFWPGNFTKSSFFTKSTVTLFHNNGKIGIRTFFTTSCFFTIFMFTKSGLYCTFMIKKLLDQLSLCSLVLTYWTESRSFELKMPLMKLALKSQSCQKLQWSLNLIKLSLKNSMRALNTCLAQLHSKCKMFRAIFCAQMTKPQDPWILTLLII